MDGGGIHIWRELHIIWGYGEIERAKKNKERAKIEKERARERAREKEKVREKEREQERKRKWERKREALFVQKHYVENLSSFEYFRKQFNNISQMWTVSCLTENKLINR